MSLQADIRKDFGSFVLDVQLCFEEGITCLLGASGCGKSLTLKAIAGIVRPDEGRIILNGRTLFDSEKGIDLPPQQRNVGYLFQNYALFPNMTVRQNILCGLHRVKDKAAKERQLGEMLKLMQLEGQAGLLPHQLSGGQQQRAALARILVSGPELLMLDEPFSALDGHLRDLLKVELKKLLNRYGKEVLMVTHSRDEAYDMCRRIGVMDEGKLLAMKPTKRLFADPGSVRAAVLTGCKNIAEARKTGPHRAYVPAWDIELETAAKLRDDLCAVGIRAHYFNAGAQHNRFPVIFAEKLEEPFETIIQFRFRGQSEDSPALWWRMSKEKQPREFPEVLGIAPVNILPLYGNTDTGR